MINILKNQKLKIILIVLLFTIICSFFLTNSYARYISRTSGDNEIRVAKYGKLKLVEKLNDEVEENDLDTISLIDNKFTLGENINKEVYLEFNNSEISSYLFLVIEGVNWQYDDSKKEFYLVNNSSSLLSFNINKEWNYLKDISDFNKFVFYIEYDVNQINSSKIEVMNQIITGIISYDDLEILDNSQITFKAYSIQKHDELTVLESWDYLHLD